MVESSNTEFGQPDDLQKGRSLDRDRQGSMPISGPEMNRHLRRAGYARRVGELSDVDVETNPPTAGQTLVWDETVGGDPYNPENNPEPTGAWVPGAGGGTVRIEVRNQSGSAIARNAAVYVSGEHTSGKPLIDLADASGNATMPAIGLAEDEIPDSTEGYVIAAGNVEGLQLDPAVYNDGDALYVSASTPGGLTNTKPDGVVSAGPPSTVEKVQKVALVTKVSSNASSNDGWAIVMGAGRVNDQNNEITRLIGRRDAPSTGSFVGTTTDTTLGVSPGSPIADNSTIYDALTNITQDLGVPNDGSVGTEKVANEAVTTSKIADDAVTGAKIASGTITSDNIAADNQYHARYDSEASTQRAAGDVDPLTCEVYYTARPDGDGYAESEETATPPSGARIVRRLYYSDKFNADPTVGADWTAYTSQPADGTSFATAKASLLAGLNDTDATANTRGTLPVSLKMEYEAVVDRLLNDYPGAESAYSVRLIDKNYSGSCMRVRNVNTNATADIGFDTDGNLDEGAIETLCGAYNGAVEIWYDQSGGGHHQVQETTTLQPFIYLGSAGRVLKENGRPVIVFTDGGQLQNVAHSTVTVNIMTPVEADGADSGYTFCVVGPGGDYSTYSNFMIGTTSGGGTRYGFCTTTGTGTPDASFTCTHFVNGTTQSSPTQASLYAAIDPQAVVTTDWLITDYSARTWYLNYNYPFAGSLQVQEYVIYYSDKSSDQAAIENDIDVYYRPTTRLLLDDYRGAAAAYSVRKLSQWHTGSCMRIREDSGDTETDIGFDSNGDLDTAAIKSFCDDAGTGVNGYVVTWYDQSGNGQDVTQATEAYQPQIYNGTAVLTDNGKPCVEFDGSNDLLTATNTAFSGTSQSMFLVNNADATTGNPNRAMVSIGPLAGYKMRILTHGPGIKFEVINNSVDWSGSPGSQNLLALIPDGGATTVLDYDLYRNGSLRTPTATNQTQNLQDCSGGLIKLGYNFPSTPGSSQYHFDGKLQEVILYNDDQSANRTDFESNINAYFSIY